jgi:hypothetical protein
MTESRGLDWNALSALMATPEPKRARLVATLKLDLLVDPTAGELSLIFPAEGSTPIRSLRNLQVSERQVDGTRWTAITVTQRELFKQFLAFCLTVADEVPGAADPKRVIVSCLQRWDQFFATNQVLAFAKQAGLIGELWVLYRIIDTIGADRALASWTAGFFEPHDFRFGDVDLEIKTTTKSKRIHTISSLAQLARVSGRQLFLGSISLQPVGPDSGSTITEAITQIDVAISHSRTAQSRFYEILHNVFRYDDSLRAEYTQRFAIRAPFRLIKIDDDFPVIDTGALRRSSQIDWSRIVDVSYSVNVEGLGFEDGSPEVDAMLPTPRAGDLL